MSNAAPNAGTEPQAGQQPAVTPQAGQVTPAAPAAQAQTSQQSSQQSAASNVDEPMSLDEARKLRKEANDLRKRVKEHDDAKQAEELARLGELEKSQKQLALLQQQHADFKRASQERIVAYEVRLAASELSFHSPTAAQKLIDWSQLEYDDDGIPTNVSKLLSKLAEKEPWLIKSDQQQHQQTPALGATNPGRAAAPAQQQQPARSFAEMARFGTGRGDLFKK